MTTYCTEKKQVESRVANMTTNKKKCCPDVEALKELQSLQKIFGVKDLTQYSHSGYQRADLPYIARDAAQQTKKRK